MAAGRKGQGGSTGSVQGRKANLSQRVRELRATIALQEQGRKFFTRSCEEKLSQNRELLPRLREAVQDIHALSVVQKCNKLTFSEVCGAQAALDVALARRTVEELAHLPLHLDLLCGMAELYHGELEDMELMAADALKAADVTKEDMDKMETQFLAEREFRYRSLAAQKDIAGRFLAQQKSSVNLEQYLKECKEKKQVLKETLKKLELKQAELKFQQPPSTIRMLEEDLRMNLRCEEARLEKMRAQMLRNQELLLEFENGIDNLFVRLHGITVPGQDDSVKAEGVKEKLQNCEQKLQYLVQRVADLPPDSRSLDEDNETFVKVRNFLEKTITDDPQNLKISLEDIDNPFDFADKDHGLVLTREDIKKQGLHLIESNKKSGKK